MPTLSIIDKSSNNWSEKVASCEKESIKTDVATSFMRKVDISHADLAKALNGCSNKALYNFTCAKILVLVISELPSITYNLHPLALSPCVWGPKLRGHCP